MSKYIEKLKKSPTYVMTLGSKELFHSNLWAWIMDSKNESGMEKDNLETKKAAREAMMKLFLDDEYSSDSKYKVSREKNHCDITIESDSETNKTIYVIENKLKSIPKSEQLKKYEEKFKDKSFKGVLTGISEESELARLEKWEYKSYKKIKTKLKEAIGGKDGFLAQILNSYCDDLECMYYLLKKQEKDNDWAFSSSEICKGLKEVHLDDIYMKIQALKLKEVLTKKFNDEFEIEVDFSRGNVCLDVFIKFEQNMKIGIQLQNKMYKKCVVSKGKKYAFEDIFKDYEGWFDSNYKNGDSEIWNKKTSMKPKNQNYNKYEGKDYNFVYQYYDIDNFSFDGLAKLIEDDIKAAKKILKDRGVEVKFVL